MFANNFRCIAPTVLVRESVDTKELVAYRQSPTQFSFLARPAHLSSRVFQRRRQVLVSNFVSCNKRAKPFGALANRLFREGVNRDQIDFSLSWPRQATNEALAWPKVFVGSLGTTVDFEVAVGGAQPVAEQQTNLHLSPKQANKLLPTSFGFFATTEHLGLMKSVQEVEMSRSKKSLGKSLKNKKRKREEHVVFSELGRKHPELGNHLSGVDSNKIDFTSAMATRALTRALLLERNITLVDLPEDRLCPPVPNRLAYLTWLAELLALAWPSSASSLPFCSSTQDGKVHVLDIGVGASCIYPLLGSSSFGWNFTGSDIDRVSLQAASRNVAANPHLSCLIELIHVQESIALQAALEPLASSLKHENAEVSVTLFSSLLQLQQQHADDSLFQGPVRAALGCMHDEPFSSLYERGRVNKAVEEKGSESAATPPSFSQPLFSAVMTNPPFYDLHEVIEPNEHTICTGSSTEMTTRGGEVCFLASILMDSLSLKHNVLWWTCMVGKKASLSILLRLLSIAGVVNVRTCRFGEGKTKRWGLAWSFYSIGQHLLTCKDKSKSPKDALVRAEIEPLMQTLWLKLPELVQTQTKEEQEQEGGGTLAAYGKRIEACLAGLQVMKKSDYSIVIFDEARQQQKKEGEKASSCFFHGSAQRGEGGEQQLFRFSLELSLDAHDLTSLVVSLYPQSQSSRRLATEFSELFEAEYMRTNRRWKRRLSRY